MRYSLFCLALLLTLGCRSAYYSTMEKFGYEKRDILASRVDDARNAQVKARDQFKTTLQRFQELTGYQGGELEATYKKLSSDYDTCTSRAEAVTSRINAVETVAKDLFAEWKQELAQYSSPDLRRQSENELRQSQENCNQLIATMRRSEARMKPVLAAFHDQVLFLKHNLNAQAIASLKGEAVKIDTDVQALIRDMDQSIQEAEHFINSIKQPPAGK